MLDSIKNLLENYDPKPLGNQKEFAVFLPLFMKDGDLHVLFEVRGTSISQAGETSFPGGRIEMDETPKEAAIRETIEELKISPESIEVFGPINYIIRDWAIVYCYVGQLHHYSLDEFVANEEVANIFSLPLSYLLNNDPTYYAINIEEHMSTDFPFERIHQGENYKFHRQEMQVPFYHLPTDCPYQLWGMTAHLTHHFCQLITKNKP